MASADDRADRRAGDDIRLDTGALQGLQDADVRPSTRRAAAEC
jgi:hypothetical protein